SSLGKPGGNDFAELLTRVRAVDAGQMLLVDGVVLNEERAAVFGEPEMVGGKLVHHHERFAIRREYCGDRAFPWLDVQMETGGHVKVHRCGDHQRLISLLGEPGLNALGAIDEYVLRNEGHRVSL